MVDKVPVRQLCDELTLQPSVFYCWQTQRFERAAVALSVPKPAASRAHQLQEKIAVPRIISDNGPQFRSHPHRTPRRPD